MEMEKRIIFRLPDGMFEQIDKAIKEGKAKTVSELIRTALSKFLTENN
jgi:Arc/MetJ-type ribon-helix-helix transcriptional regulator